MTDNVPKQSTDWARLVYLLLMAAAFAWLFNALALGFQANWGKSGISMDQHPI